MSKYKAVNLLIAVASGLVFAQSAAAQEFPSKPIKIIVPYSAGGPTDMLARSYAKVLSDLLGQPVVVDNRPGAGGNIGVDLVVKSNPDGYTIGFTAAGPLVVNGSLFRRMPYDASRDIAPVAFVAAVPNVIAVHPSLGISSLQELIAKAKSSPGSLMFASGGNGTAQHLGGELFNSMADIKITHVPYKGEGPAITDAIAGHVPVVLTTLSAGLPFFNSDRLIPLAVTTKQRSSVLPDVPSASEAGVPGYVAEPWFGVFAPAKTPKLIIQKLNEASNQAILSAEVSENIKAIGGYVTPGSPEQFSEYMKAETLRWKEVIDKTGAKVD
ncbi:ABC transporter substrate-binding protein [Pollutimonas nitritireducens]|uniref:ABC transporter substrate-binding protein n=1 Tax=Pollutimonas nitritireducens TaxID=2045209 RepID=A0A2N4ULP5_9BURK|nr:tripartite tricarboxylate transporter substrate binding protein [Pollutimonas nitritireducens]PLC55918.1 ABC transporter substrate-binding protein [Pollutimonas nitritireducens]